MATKAIKSNRVNSTLIRNRVHKTLQLDSGSDGVEAVTFISASSLSSADYNQISQSRYDLLRGSFYYHSFPTEKFCGVEYRTEKLPCTYGNFDQYAHLTPNVPQYRHKFYPKGIVYAIPKKYYGDGIWPGTFSLTDNSNSTGFIIKDDSDGNLYAVDADNYVSESSTIGDIIAPSSISSSDNYVGNIFYDLGLVVITETGSYSGSSTYYYNGGSDYEIQLDSNVIIDTMEYECVLKANEWNTTSNDTILQNELTSSLLGTGSLSPYINLLNSRVVVRKDTTIDDQFLTSEWSPYITSVGLYNKRGDLLITAVLPEPIKKSKKRDITIKIQMDF